jgi:uncharacterized membrane protein YhhN
MSALDLATVATLVALAVLLAVEQRGWGLGVWILKPLTSTGFLAVAVLAGALDSSYGRAILAGLAASWLGDVLLIPDSKKSFRLGLFAFLSGHVAYVVAFVERGVVPVALGLGLAGAVVPALLVDRWLRPHVPPGLGLPVRAYILVISTMVASAIGTFTARPDLVLLGGALAFYVSDLAVARRAFVSPGFVNKLWGLPLYYGAQLALARTV